MAVQRLGRRAGFVALRSAYGGGVLGALGLAGWAVVRLESTIARRRIGEPTDVPPDATGTYGRHPGPALRLVMLGDSGATGLGCERPEQTPGALLAGGVARDLGRRVRLDVLAVVGGRSADLETQVARALRRQVDLAVVMVGANDVTHGVRPGEAARQLGLAVRALRAAGAIVVVATCPDLGTVEPLPEPLRTLAAYLSRRMAAAQAVAVAENGGIAVSLGSLLGPEFSEHAHLWSADRFHPSAEGYQRVADALLPSLLESLGVGVPTSTTVQDVGVAAAVAAREGGLAVQAVEGVEGAAGAGRLARLVRRLPLVGAGAPEPREPEGAEEGDEGHPQGPSQPSRNAG